MILTMGEASGLNSQIGLARQDRGTIYDDRVPLIGLSGSPEIFKFSADFISPYNNTIICLKTWRYSQKTKKMKKNYSNEN